MNYPNGNKNIKNFPIKKNTIINCTLKNKVKMNLRFIIYKNK